MKKIFSILILGMVVLCGLVSNLFLTNITEINVHASMATPANFTIIALPDTQYYAESYPAIYTNQTQWIVNHKDALNIVYVTGEGDITDVGTQDIQWQRADAAYTVLENPTTTQLPYGIPYTIPPGNHDQPTTLFNHTSASHDSQAEATMAVTIRPRTTTITSSSTQVACLSSPSP